MNAIDPLKTKLVTSIPHGSPLLGCRFDPSGRFLFVSAQDETIQRIDLVTSQKTALVGHTSWVRGIAFCGNFPPLVPVQSRAPLAALLGGHVVARAAEQPLQPMFLLSGDYHGNLLWWEGHAEQPQPVRSIPAHDGWIRAVAISPNGCLIATCANDKLVKLWAIADGRHLHTFEGHDSHVYNVAFHPNREALVSADHHGVLKHWDLKSLKFVRDLEAKVLHKYDEGFRAHIGGIRGMSFDPTGTTLACSGITNVSNAFAGVGNPGIVVLDWHGGKTRVFTTKDAYQGTAWGIHVHPAGYVIAGGANADGRIWFWKMSDAANVHTLVVPAGVRDLAVHPDGTTFAVATLNGTAMIYSMAS